MKVYVDTNILVAASVQDYPHHSQSFELVSKIKDGTLQGCISTHGLAEFYSVLTISGDDYKEVLSASVKAGLIGGVVYDALHLRSAHKAGCGRIYTFNVKDFRALATDEFQHKICAP